MIIQPASKSARLAHLKSRRSGAALILAVIVFAACALYLVSYFVLTQNEYTAVARSQTWNNSLTLAEAGVEDALALINKNAGNIVDFTSWSGTAGSQDNWSVSGNVYSMTRWLGTSAGSSNLGYYTVYITNNVGGTNPSILSIGCATWNGSSSTFNAGTAVRKVFVQTKASAFADGNLVSVTNTDFKGNNVVCDSFDSSDPLHSDWQTTYNYHGYYYGTYPLSDGMAASGDTNTSPPEPFKRKDNAFVATDASVIDVQNASVAGWVDTAPGGTVSIKNNNGTVGDVSWVFGTNSAGKNAQSGIETNRVRDDMNAIFPPVVLPSDPWIITNSTICGCISNNNNNSPCYYEITGVVKNNLDIYGNNVVIWLPQGLQFSGNNTLTLHPNSDVTFYVDSGFTFSGNSTINSGEQYALALSLYGLPDCTDIDLGGNANFTGYVYSPEATLHCGGGGNTPYGVVGAFIVNTIQLNGNVNFHYDEALAKNAPAIAFKPVLWQEVQ